MKTTILFLTFVVAAVMGAGHDGRLGINSLTERASDTDVSAETLFGEARMLLSKASKALEPTRRDIKEYSSQVLSYSKELFASDPKTRSAAFGNSRALARTGADLLNRAAKALSPLKKDATELATRAVSTVARAAGLSNKHERGFLSGLTSILTGPLNFIIELIEYLLGENTTTTTTAPAAGGGPSSRGGHIG